MRALFDNVGAHGEAFQPLTRLQQRTGHVGGSHQNSGYPDRPAKLKLLSRITALGSKMRTAGSDGTGMFRERLLSP